MHLKALSKLLLMRTTESCEVKPPANRAWERSIFESFIYHSAVVTLFDSDFNPIEDLQLVLDKLSNRFHDVSGISYFEAIVETVFRSPTLGAPSEVFVTLIQATRQARTTRTLSFEEKSAIWSDYYKIREWQSKLDMACELSPHFSIWMGKPYVVTIRLLLLYNILSGDDKLGASESIKTEVRNTMAEATALLANIGDYLCRTWGKYLLWPLAIIGATISRPADIEIVRDLLDKILKRSNSSTVLPVQKVLEERIWNVMREDDHTGPLDGITLSGLKLILDNQIMGNACHTSKVSP
jgi:Fungal specific transcription factor domain